MKKRNNFNCFIIGESSLTIQCAQALIKEKQELLGIVSSASQVKKWCLENNILCLYDVAKLKEYEFDYLFCVVYYRILSNEFLKLPRYFCINYHDALLPKYAGMHATSWAILNDKKTHGVTWHVMTNEVDAGDILKQGTVTIDPDETCLTLNLKCYEKALKLFNDLIVDLKTENVVPYKQDLMDRTYYSFDQKPINNGVISWDQPTEDIYRLYRALNFGNYVNRFSSLKFICQQNVFVIKEMIVSSLDSSYLPGTIASIDNKYIYVVTKDGVVGIGGIFSIFGREFNIDDFCRKFGITIGYYLDNPQQDKLSRIIQASVLCNKNENFWVQNLCKITSDIQLAFMGGNVVNINSNGYIFRKIVIADDLLNKLSIKCQSERHLILLVMLLIYFYKLNNSSAYAVDITYPQIKDLVVDTLGAFSYKVPLHIDFDQELSLMEVIENFFEYLELIIKKTSYWEDIVLRYPKVKKLKPILRSVLIELTDSPIGYQPKFSDGHKLVIMIPKHECQIYLYLNNVFFEKEFVNELDVLSSRLESIIEKILADSLIKVGELPLLTNNEHEFIATQWNKIKFFGKNDTLQQLFEQQARVVQNNIAITYAQDSLTYEQLNKIANQLARVLRDRYKQIYDLAMPRGVIIGVYLQPSFETIISILSILKAGGTYLPLDPNHPKKRIELILADARPAIVVSNNSEVGKILPVFNLPAQILNLDEVKQEIVTMNDGNLPAINCSKDLAYIIYTSGTTGKPKGVMIPHINVVNLFLATQPIYSFKQTDVWTLFHSYTFDFSVWEIWGALLNGGKLIILPYFITRDPIKFRSTIIENKVTILNQTPAAFQQLIDVDKSYDNRMSSLRYVIFGGDTLNVKMLKTWWDKYEHDQPQLVNMYGITETTIHTTYYKLSTLDLQNTNINSPIGKKLDNHSCYVLDKNFHLLPPGVYGELYVGGISLASGYLNLPDLTKEKFVHNIYITASDEERRKNLLLYKTGDLVKYLPDGSFDFMGRIDNQIKIRGFRIEISEIESVIQKCEGIEKAIVLMHCDQERNEKYLVTYYISVTKAYDVALLKKHLTQYLPEYMIPAVFIQIEKFPLTYNGKIDKELLPKPILSSLYQNRCYMAPKTPEEQKFVDIYKKILCLDKISMDDNFFALGGHSLLATKLTMEINKIFDVNCSIKDIFVFHEVKNLYNFIKKLQTGKQAKPIFLSPNESGKRFPLSFVQQGMYFIYKYGKNAAYNIPINVKLCGSLNIIALEWAINQLMLRHECLRTVFFENADGEISQQIVDYSIKLQPQKINQYDIDIILKNIASHEFSLSKPQLLVHLFETEHEQYILSFILHHIICDGWSMGILKKELGILYDSYPCVNTNLLPEVTTKYVDFAVWQKGESCAKKIESQVLYWQTKLEGANYLELPTDFTRPAIKTYSGGSYTFNLDVNFSKQWQDRTSVSNTTDFMVLLTIFKILLHRYAGQDDIVVGSPIANRNYTGLENIIGCFVNTLVLRTDLSNNPTCIELLNEVKTTCINAYANQDVPFEKLVDILKIERNLGATPIFNVVFVLQNAADIDSFNFSNIIEKPINVTNNTSKFDLVFNVSKTQNSFNCVLEYNKDLYLLETINRMAQHFCKIAEQVIDNPWQRIGDISLFTNQEFLQLMSFSQSQTDNLIIEPEFTLHKIFSSLAKQYPDKTALICCGQAVSYYELNIRANRLAYYLISLGVAPKTIIGVYIERSIDMVVSLLAILKADCVYLPIDISLPKERIKFMLTDANVQWVLLAEKKVEPFIDNHNINLIFSADGQYYDNNCQEDPVSNTLANDIAYIIYTSGSTGAPKGAIIPHRSVFGFMFGINYATFNEEQIFLQYSSISWDALTLELWTPLLHAATCVLYPGHNITIENIKNIIIDNEVTTLWMTSSFFNMVIDSSPEILKTVKQLLIGGESLSIKHVQKAISILPNTKIINGYGPSECTVFACCYPIANNIVVEKQKSIPIGKPIGDRKVYILDKYMKPVPIGIVGEIYIGGDAVPYGYINQPNLNKEKFISDLFNVNPSSKLYKTGDLAYWKPDGTIEFIGRSDNQIKLHGYRIELGEIEMALKKHPIVKDAVVILREDEPETKYLAAYVLVKNDTFDKKSEVLDDIYSMLKEKLPIYMLPKTLSLLNEFPLSSNNKVDAKRFPIPLREDSFVSKYIAPKTESEQKLAKLWNKILGTKDIGVDDNFFYLGGNSILSIRLAIEINKAFAKQVTAMDIFKYPTIGRLANHISNDIKYTKNVFLINGSRENNRNLFLIHSGEGLILEYYKLASYINSVNLYGIANPYFADISNAFTRIEDMAAFYLDQVKHIQSEGPYNFSGWSFGGVVALEMAKQLQMQGGLIRNIVLIDSYNLYGKDVILSNDDFCGLMYSNNIIPNSKEWKAFNIEVKNNLKLAKLYNPGYYDGEVILLKANDIKTSNKIDYAANGWQKIIKKLCIHEIPGNHYNLFEPQYIKNIAKILELSLKEK